MNKQAIEQTAEKLYRAEESKRYWAKEVEGLKEALSKEMDRRQTDNLSAGQYRLKRTRYERVCINTEALKANAPTVYQRFTEAREVVKLNVEVNV